MLSAVVSQRLPVSTPIEYSLDNGFTEDVFGFIKQHQPRVVWMAVPNTLERKPPFDTRLAELTKIADWRRKGGHAFAVTCPYHGLARTNSDLICLINKPGVFRSVVFGDSTTEAYMVIQNLSPDLFTPADQYSHIKDQNVNYEGVGVDMTPHQAEVVSCLLAEHFTGSPQASVANISLFSDICMDLNVEEMALLNEDTIMVKMMSVN